ncbi:MAG: hypothetical protein O3A10_00135 [Chloroflexi bacterium]|nr:hypothetical protein [Chloroflexota bacterium]MDA1145365.1 hypothetical protein [Chloroflexota bacterium]
MLKRTLLVLMTVTAIGAAACSDSDSDEPTATSTPIPTATADGGGAAGTFPTAMGPGISVTEALDSSLDGALLVNGFLVITPEGARLCELLAESFPPQCGGASLIVDGPDLATFYDLTTEGDVSWSEDHIQLLGDIDGDTISFQSLASS